MSRWLALACRVLTLAALVGAVSAQTTWYVDVNGTPPGAGTQADPYTSIQYAIEQSATVTGDTLLIESGTYAERIDLSGKGLRLVGSQGYAATVIDGGQAGPVLTIDSGEPTSTELQGLTLTHGANEPPSGTIGSGLVCIGTSPVVRDCLITSNGLVPGPPFSNATERGGGVYLRDSNAILEDCLITDNTAVSRGCGIYAEHSPAAFIRCTIAGNSFVGEPQTLGGGLYSEAAIVQLMECTVENNWGNLGGGGHYGLVMARNCIYRNNWACSGAAVYGALEVTDSVLVGNYNAGLPGECGSGGGAFSSTLVRCELVGNFACQWGGGANTSTLIDCLLEDNWAAGGMHGFGLGGGAANSNLLRCTVIANRATHPYGTPAGGGIGGGLYLCNAEACMISGNSANLGGGAHASSLDRCTVVGNYATETSGGCEGGSITSSVIWDNHPNGVGGPAVVTYSDVQDGWPGAGNIDADPRFWSLATPDLHLFPDSPCIDAGDPAGPPDPNLTRADMGALPYDPTYCGPGCNGAIGAPYCSATTNSSGVPAVLSALGSTALAADVAVLRVTELPPNQFGYFLMSESQGFLPMLGGGQGNLCLALPIIRFDRAVLFSGIIREVNFRVRVGALPQGTVFAPGESWNFQYWFRDINPQFTSNTSLGLEITWQ